MAGESVGGSWTLSKAAADGASGSFTTGGLQYLGFRDQGLGFRA